jgi:hypothetical protein
MSGEKIRRHNICGTKRPEVQIVQKTKRPGGQNVRTQKILLTYFQYIYILKTSIIIFY